MRHSQGSAPAKKRQPLKTLKPAISALAVKKRSAVERVRGSRLHAQRNTARMEQPLCVGCLAKDPIVIRAWTQLDHIIPLADGGVDDLSNTQGLCDECHATKTASETRRRAAGG